ncbi:hypothetical protein [Lacrimispora indolis]|uniref:hypothetical protein n=1 Tax=Lacrimispora indolis TaxID=69825 RepID=UPI00045E83C5|nr:hypothetical protein [Lacrimispora indolis]
MSSTNKTSLGLNMWEASDKPVRQDFVNDNVIINEKITKLNSDLQNQIATTNSNLTKILHYASSGAAITANTLFQKDYTVSEFGLTGKTIIGVITTLRYFPGNTYHQISVSSMYSESVGFRVQICSDYTGTVMYNMYILYK